MISAISQRDIAAPALNYGVPSAYAFWRVGSIKLQIFSVDKLVKHSEILLIAACFTSASLSFNKRIKVWIKLLSVISLPKLSANAAKFLAYANLTFHDLSSPAANRVPRVWI